MILFRNLAPTVVCAASFFGSAAMADVTPTQVWDNWQALIDRSGNGSVTVGNLDESGGALVATDVIYTFAGEDATSSVMIDRITLRDNGDGTVEVMLPDNIPVSVKTAKGETLDLHVTPGNAQTTVSGTPEAMNYAVSADQYVVGLTQMTQADGTPADLDFRFALNGLAGDTQQNAGDDLNIVYDFTADSVDLLIDGIDDENGDQFTLSGKIDAMAVDADLTVPEGANLSDPDAADMANVNVSAGYGYESAAYIFATSSDKMTADGTATTGPVRLDFGVDPDSLQYAVRAQDLETALRGTELPTSVEVSLDAYDIGLTMPLGPSDVPEPFAMTFGLTGLTLNDETWAMADPSGMIPRDPANLTIDLAGTMRTTEDAGLMTGDDMDSALSGRSLASLDVNEIMLSAAGALVRATGAFSIDNDGTQTLSDVMTPEGSATVTLTGLNQLIDRLIAMGVVPQDQAMMGRMMLGMFTKPVGDDTLETVFEFSSDGQISANGQRIR